MLNRVFVPGTAGAVAGLAVTMTVGYGTLFYSFSIMSGEFVEAFGWSRSFVFAVFSAGLLASGLIAPSAGNLLDRTQANCRAFRQRIFIQQITYLVHRHGVEVV